MSTVSLAALFEALDIPCREALEQAAVNCAARGGYEITIDDYMECLLPLDDMRDILAQFERNAEVLREILAKNRPPAGRHTGRPSFSPLLYQLLQEAYLLTTLELRQESINTGALVLALLAPIAAGLIQMAISRSREYLADDTGAELCGQPLALAGALAKLGAASGRIPMQEGNPSTEQMFIVAPMFSIDGSMANLFSTHPPLEERIRRLQAMAAARR